MNSSIFAIILEKAYTAVTKSYMQLYYSGLITVETDINQAQVDIINELKNIRIGIEFIKQHMVDVDSIMTKEDRKALEEAEKDLREGKTKRL